jgi:acyl-CoA synthetase (AMP-forming)/AMP-acid ligase II
VVALQLPNVPHFLTAYFGALKAGMVVLPLNPLLMAPELEYHLGDSSAKLLIGFEGMHAEASKACERLGIQVLRRVVRRRWRAPSPKARPGTHIPSSNHSST